MTQYTTLDILPVTEYGVPSGNYDGSSPDFIGNAIPAANYYGGQGPIQTITFGFANLSANVTTQATLSDSPEQAAWFDIYNFVGNVSTDTYANSVLGNFSWLRVSVKDFTAGNITTATVAY
jgi:hypothetical protein